MKRSPFRFGVRRAFRKAGHHALASFWLVPLALTFGGMFTCLATFAVAGWLPDDLPGFLSVLLGTWSADGARAVLGTIASSMLAIAATTFSITLAAIVFASSSFGPHILPQYRRNRLVQATLGVFLGNFAYGLIGLFAVRSEGPTTPALTIFGALVSALVGLVMLVVFIGHMVEMLHVSRIVGETGEQAQGQLKKLLPEPSSDSGIKHRRVHADDPLPAESEGDLLYPEGSGYVQAIATDVLLTTAKKQDLTIEILASAGGHVTRSTPIARVAPGLENDRTAGTLAGAFMLGHQRSPAQDVAFVIDELAAIALRALSPGINDPFTAIDVMHEMESLIDEASRGEPLPSYTIDEDDTPRLKHQSLDFQTVLDLTYEKMAQSIAANDTASRAMLTIYERHFADLASKAPERHALASAFRRFVGLIPQAGLPDALVDELEMRAREISAQL